MRAREHRDIAVCVDRMRGLTHESLAGKYKVSVETVRNAIKWGEEKGVFRIDAQISVEEHILETRDTIGKIERRLDKILEMAEEYDTTYDTPAGKRFKMISPRQYIVLFQELREQRMLLMELEGVYKKQLNVGDIMVENNNVFLLPAKMDATEWEAMARKTPGELRSILEQYRAQKVVS